MEVLFIRRILSMFRQAQHDRKLSVCLSRFFGEPVEDGFQSALQFRYNLLYA